MSKDDPHYQGNPFDVSQTAGSGNVSARYQVTKNVALTALVGRGFRAPNIQERSFFGLATQPDTYILQNPNMKSETSLNYELGFKVRYARYSGGFNVYQNNVNDFIGLAFLGPDPETGLELAQFKNTERATIRGAEFQLESYLSDSWTAFGNVTYIRGTDDKTGDPLPLIAPVKGVLGVRYQQPTWWGELDTRMVARQDRVATGYEQTPGFAVMDLRGGYEFSMGLTAPGRGREHRQRRLPRAVQREARAGPQRQALGGLQVLGSSVVDRGSFRGAHRAPLLLSGALRAALD